MLKQTPAGHTGWDGTRSEILSLLGWRFASIQILWRRERGFESFRGCPYVFGMGEDGGMTTWFRTYYEDEDLWLYFEADDEGWAERQVEVRAQDSRPVTAASLAEVLHLRDHADLAAMSRYEQQYGVLAEGPMDGWQDQPQAAEISAAEFEQLWTEARRTLGRSA